MLVERCDCPSSRFLLDVKQGNTLCFWADLWDTGVIEFHFPQLFSFAGAKKFQSENFYPK
jgi:hypothetical protein